MKRSKRQRRKKFSDSVIFSKILIVINRENLNLQLIAALPANEQAGWTTFTREKLNQSGCRLPERFIAPYILLNYFSQKYNLGTNQAIDLLSIPKDIKTYADVVILYKKLGSSERPPEWSEEVPKVFLPPMGPFSYHYFSGNKVIRYNGTIQKLYVMNEKILDQIGFQGQNINNEVLEKAGEDHHFMLKECERILQDKKFSRQADGLLELISELHKTSVGFKKGIAAKPAKQETLGVSSPTLFESVEDARLQPSLRAQFFDCDKDIVLGEQIVIRTSNLIIPEGKDIPDYNDDYPTSKVDYYRKLVDYLQKTASVTPVYLAVENKGTAVVRNVNLEVMVDDKNEQYIFFDENSYPETPSIDFDSHIGKTSAKIRLSVMKYAPLWKIEAIFGRIQPKKILKNTSPLYIGAKSSCTLNLEAVLYADEISEPVHTSLAVVIRIEKKLFDLKELPPPREVFY
jgi:hypothetical protein